MLAEFLREVAVLVLVFYPIEDHYHVAGSFRGIILLSAGCLALGIGLERWR